MNRQPHILAGAECRELGTSLFAAHPFDRGWCDHILRQGCGSLIVDNLHEPRIALLQDGRTGFCLAWGDAKQAEPVVRMALPRLKESRWPLVSLPDATWRDFLRQRFPGQFWQFPRVDLYRNAEFAAESAPATTGAEVAIAAITDDLAGRIASELDPDFGVLWPDPVEFVRTSFGFCALAGTQLASYAVSGFAPERCVCVGVATAPAFRGHGLATRCMQALVERCWRLRMPMEFCTGSANTPARALARRLGFGREQQHLWLGLNR